MKEVAFAKENAKWIDLKILKKSSVSTFLCLIGCSIGTMSIIYFMSDFHWIISLLSSFVLGLISCILFIFLWKIFLFAENFKDALYGSMKMSFVSMMIMMVIENAVMYLSQSHNHIKHTMNVFWPMTIGMSLGFFIALPYNYYHLQKSGKTCH